MNDRGRWWVVVASLLGAVVVSAAVILSFESIISQLAEQASSEPEVEMYVTEDSLSSLIREEVQVQLEEVVPLDEGEAAEEVVEASPLIEAYIASGKDTSLVSRSDDGVWVYRIQAGDTLCELSGMFGVSVDELGAFNQIRDLNVICEGASLRIPHSEGSALPS